MNTIDVGTIVVTAVAVIAGALLLLFLAGRFMKGYREGRGSPRAASPNRTRQSSDADASAANRIKAPTAPPAIIASPPAGAVAAPGTARPGIFMSYRRDDNPYVAGRIYDGLIERFGPDGVFKDVDSLPIGVDFRAAIDDAVAKATVALVVIGPRWLSRDAHDKRRIDDARDFVRLEVAAALRRGIHVVPLLIDGATMPDEAELPEDVRSVTFRNALAIRPDPDFRNDFDRLVRGIRDIHHPPDSKSRGQTSGFPNETAVDTNRRVLSVRVHRAKFVGGREPCYFVNLTNLSPSRVIEVTHLWYEDEIDHIPVAQPSRPLPVRLDLDQSWETWLEASRVSSVHQHDALTRFRARISTGEIVASVANTSVPPFGTVPGGPIIQSG